MGCATSLQRTKHQSASTGFFDRHRWELSSTDDSHNDDDDDSLPEGIQPFKDKVDPARAARRREMVKRRYERLYKAPSSAASSPRWSFSGGASDDDSDGDEDGTGVHAQLLPAVSVVFVRRASRTLSDHSPSSASLGKSGTSTDVDAGDVGCGDDSVSTTDVQPLRDESLQPPRYRDSIARPRWCIRD